MAKKMMASAAKKSARIVSLAAMAASMHLTASDAQAMQAAFADMAEEYGHHALIIDMTPLGGIIA